jgi:hypothetical protein
LGNKLLAMLDNCLGNVKQCVSVTARFTGLLFVSPVRFPRGGRGHSTPGPFSRWQQHREATADPFLAGGGDLPAMRLDNALGDG